MKVALYEAVDRKSVSYLFYPLGLGYLAAFLRNNLPGVEVRVFKSLEDLLHYQPDLTGISCMSPNYNIAVRAIRSIKKEIHSPVVLGGTHISSIPETLPAHCDAGVLGEGERTFLELVKLHIKNTKPDKEQLARIDGLVFRHEGELHFTKYREPVPDLDIIPPPAREWKHNVSNRWSFTSRGCPYNCVFCYSSLFWDKCRFNSPGYVVEELLSLGKESVAEDHTFLDDLFCAKPERAREISALIKEKIHHPISFTVTARANLVNEELARILTELGAQYVHLGLESGSDPVLSYLKREDCSVEQNQRALDILHHHGIRSIGTFIIGAPVETEEDLEKTYRFIKNNLASGKLFAFSFGPLLPFPGTKIWDYGVERGIIDPPGFDWESLTINITDFDRERYVRLCEKISPERFYHYFDKINEMMVYEY